MPEQTEESQLRPTLTDHGEQKVTGEVQITMANDTIVVTMAGTIYSVTYRKTKDSPWLVASDILDDPKSPIGRFTFRAHAWTAANEKARELGWIV